MSSLTYAIADLHGRRDLLDLSIEAIAAHAATCAPGDRTVVFLGDYVDKGPDSRGVLERLIDGPAPGWRWICLAGNHDTAMLRAAIGRGLDSWFRHGGHETLASYGETVTVPPFAQLPRAHLDWIAGLTSWHRDARRVFVHGGVDPTLPLERQSIDVLQRKRYVDDDPGHFGLGHVVHGHNPNPAGPLLHPGRTALDTLAWKTGRLVVAVFEDDRAGGPVDLIEVSGPAAPGGDGSGS